MEVRYSDFDTILRRFPQKNNMKLTKFMKFCGEDENSMANFPFHF